MCYLGKIRCLCVRCDSVQRLILVCLTFKLVNDKVVLFASDRFESFIK